MNILDQIIEHKRKEVAQQKALYPAKLLEQSVHFESPTVSFSDYIADPLRSGIIAEFKRKSPSRGPINPYVSVEETTIGYMQAGASALSILTDQKFFNGKNADLTEARQFNYCPILRKDFTIDEYQIIEAKSIGADAILLIAEVLKKDEVKSLSKMANSLNLEVLLEMHSAEQLDKINDNISVIGINNRDLTTFQTSIEISKRIGPLLPEQIVRISESGISNPQAIIELKQAGYQGFLIGEYFMNHAQPHKACKDFIKSLKQQLN